MAGEAEVQAEIVLREVAAGTAHFVGLNEVPGGNSDASVQSEPVALGSAEFESNPVVVRSSPGTEDDGFALEILDDDFLRAVVKEVANCQSPAHARNFECGPDLVADIAERAVALIQEQLAGLAEDDADLGIVNLRVDVAVNGDEIEPAIVIDVVEGVAPADDVGRGAGDVGDVRDVGKGQLTLVAEQLQVLLTEVGDGDRGELVVQVIAER